MRSERMPSVRCRFVTSALMCVVSACASSEPGGARGDGAPAAGSVDASRDATTTAPADAARDASTTDSAAADASSHPLDDTWLMPVMRAGDKLRSVPAEPGRVQVRLACDAVAQGVHPSVEVTTLLRDCEALGPIVWQLDASGHLWVQVNLWVSDAPCTIEAPATRFVPVAEDLPTGVYPVQPALASLDAPTATLEVLAATAAGCGNGSACSEGEICVVGDRTEQACVGRCLPECHNVMGCQPTTCTVQDCGGRAPPARCDQVAECPEGMACSDGGCEWAERLSGAARHPCESHTDCRAGLSCIEDDQGLRECDVPCNAANMRCPAAHYCATGTQHTTARWVCEWVGE